MSNHSSRIDTQAMHQRNETKHLIITVDFAYIMEYHSSHILFLAKMTCIQIQGHF